MRPRYFRSSDVKKCPVCGKMFTADEWRWHEHNPQRGYDMQPPARAPELKLIQAQELKLRREFERLYAEAVETAKTSEDIYKLDHLRTEVEQYGANKVTVDRLRQFMKQTRGGRKKKRFWNR